MIRRKREPWILAFAALLAFACSSGSYTDGTIAADGDWHVDFGKDQGVLRLEEGRIVALCYGQDVVLGGYTVKDGWLFLTMDFMDGREQLFAGKVQLAGQSGFRLELADAGPGSQLEFSPFTGDCAAVPAH